MKSSERMAYCPVCNSMVSADNINKHISVKAAYEKAIKSNDLNEKKHLFYYNKQLIIKKQKEYEKR